MGGPGSGGHNRKSRRRHLRDGTYRPDRHGVSRPAPAGALPSRAPAGLGRHGLAFYRQYRPLLEEIGVLDAGTWHAFVTLCRLWQRWMEINAALDRDGLVVQGTRGPKRHPLWSTYLQVARELRALLADFGMTPRGRERLGIEAPGPSLVEVLFSRLEGEADADD